MYELKQLGARSYYINGSSNMGLFRTGEKDAVLIDSGDDPGVGTRIAERLTEQDWTLKAIFNTHAHSDHVGSNKYLQDRYHCSSYMAGMEAPFTRNATMWPGVLYGGCPPKHLWSRYLYGEPCFAKELTPGDLPPGLTTFPAPGHSPEQIGYRTEDGVYYLGDVVVGSPTLNRFGITYIFNVVEYLKTLDAVEKMQGEWFVAAHADPVKDVVPLVQINRAKVWEIAERIRTFCDGVTEEQIVRHVLNCYRPNLSMTRYYIVTATVRAYISMLADRGDISSYLTDHRIAWYRSR